MKAGRDVPRALERLPENVRRAFELSRFEKMTYNQIAEEMSVSPKNQP